MSDCANATPGAIPSGAIGGGKLAGTGYGAPPGWQMTGMPAGGKAPPAPMPPLAPTVDTPAGGTAPPATESPTTIDCAASAIEGEGEVNGGGDATAEQWHGHKHA